MKLIKIRHQGFNYRFGRHDNPVFHDFQAKSTNE